MIDYLFRRNDVNLALPLPFCNTMFRNFLGRLRNANEYYTFTQVSDRLKARVNVLIHHYVCIPALTFRRVCKYSPQATYSYLSSIIATI